jgi:hypothetical protein
MRLTVEQDPWLWTIFHHKSLAAVIEASNTKEIQQAIVGDADKKPRSHESHETFFNR